VQRARRPSSTPSPSPQPPLRHSVAPPALQLKHPPPTKKTTPHHPQATLPAHAQPESGSLGTGYPHDESTKAWLSAKLDAVFGYHPIVRFSWETAGRCVFDPGGAFSGGGGADDGSVDVCNLRARVLASRPLKQGSRPRKAPQVAHPKPARRPAT